MSYKEEKLDSTNPDDRNNVTLELIITYTFISHNVLDVIMLSLLISDYV